jgi:GNAT superfamily N-acetyltransferase
MDIALSPLEPADDATIDSVLALQTAAQALDTPDLPPPCRYRFIGSLRHPVSSSRRERYVARADDTLVGYLDLVLPLRDNTENADASIQVNPEHRRRGVGRQLHSYAVERLRELGRKRMTGGSIETMPGGPERDGAGSAFAAAVGAKAALTEVRRKLDLSTVDDSDLARLLEAAWAKASGYSLAQWGDSVPDEYIDGVAYLDSSFLAEAPTGDLAWEPEQVDAARVREREEAQRHQGVRSYSSAMVHDASGRVVALTAIGLERSTPDHAYQWITLVDPRHRGHRLGTVAKLENLRYAREHEPQLSTIDTWNADVNDHMIAINEAMGFRPIDRFVHWQQDV